MLAIGVDIGGTTVKAGLVDDSGKILCKNVCKTAETGEKTVENINGQIADLLNSYGIELQDIKGIGVGCPGIISSDKGIVEKNSNMKWKHLPLVKLVREKYPVTVKISNDANVAALGETLFGCTADYDNSIMLTLGTGVGGGIIIDKKIYEGGFTKGAELGHTVVQVDGELCGCGRRGCLEAYASATGLIRMTKEEMLKNRQSAMWEYVGGDIDKVDGKTSFECSKKGDASANAVVDKYVKYLSEGIMNFHNVFRPQIIILGGGVSAQGDYLTDKIKRYCEKFYYGYESAPVPEIVTATLGNDAGIIGAAALVLK